MLARVDEPEQRRRLAWSTAIFSLATGLSRMLGLVREIVAPNYFGIGGRSTRSRSRFRCRTRPRARRRRGALVGVRPVFTELLEKGDRSAPGASPRRLFWLLLLGLGGLTALFIVVAPC